MICLGLLAACGGPATGGRRAPLEAPRTAPDVSVSDAASCATPGPLRPVSPTGQSSSIVLGRLQSGPLSKSLLAFVADEDGRAVAIVDVGAKRAVGVVPLPEAPRDLLILADGRLLATLPQENRLAVIAVSDDGRATLSCTRETDAEPISIAATEDGRAVFVSAGWGGTLTRYDAALERQGSFSLGRDPRQVVLSDDERLAFVSHAVGGKVSVVDVEKRAVLEPIPVFADPHMPSVDRAGTPRGLASMVERAVEGGARRPPGEGGLRIGTHGMTLVKSAALPGRLLLPQVFVDPGDPRERAEGYGNGGGMVFESVFVIDATTRTGLSPLAGDEAGVMFDDALDSRGEPLFSRRGCLDPRGAAIDDDTATLLVACFGAGTVVAHDAASVRPVDVAAAEWDVGAGPTGVAVDPTERRALVWSQVERSIDVVHLDELGAVERPADRPRREKIELPALEAGPSLDILLGRQIFFGIGDTRVSSRGLGCATCHVDGRDDGLVWTTADGPRRTPSLAGGLDAPFGWSGVSEDLEVHLDRELRALAGGGLRSVQRSALLAYLGSLRPPPARRAASPALAARGQALFESKGCASCHPGGGTDAKSHDVGSKTAKDKKGAFDTPSLRRVVGRAPFFHDGRYPTLREVLLEGHGEGATRTKLDAGDAEALEAFLSTL